MREIVDAVKTAVPDAANGPAGEVLEYVRGRLIDTCIEQPIYGQLIWVRTQTLRFLARLEWMPIFVNWTVAGLEAAMFAGLPQHRSVAF